MLSYSTSVFSTASSDGEQNMIKLLPCAIIVGCVAVASGQDPPAAAGPYVAKITAIKECSDPGKDIYSAQMKYNAEKDTWDGVFFKKDQLGDNTVINADVHIMEGEEWKKEFSQYLGGVCTLMKAAPEAVHNFLEAMNVRDCPMSEGSTVIKELKNSFMMPFMKEMKYGKRQGELSLNDKDGNRLGCFAFEGEIVPKPAE